MGVVLRAYDDRLHRDVSLKILRPDLSGDEGTVGRFAREARIAASLRHPHIVTVHAVGEENCVHYFAMEYVEGVTLADMIRDSGPLPAGRTRILFSELLSGLAAAHNVGAIHRDVKPSNILLDGADERVRITDFGLARMRSAQTRMTLPQSLFGTPAYMSPEHARGAEGIDHCSDLYSAGVVLYEMLAGHTPFQANAPSAVVHQILNKTPPDPRGFCGDIDMRLASVALRLMAKCAVNCWCEDATDFDYYEMRNGLTQPGSSGSGSFNLTGQLTGQLLGKCTGYPDSAKDLSCSNLDDWAVVYGEFETTYDRISTYLNIGGTMYVNWDPSFILQNGTAAFPYETVGQANNAAWDGLQIMIAAGSYPETLTMTKKLTLVANGGTVTIGETPVSSPIP